MEIEDITTAKQLVELVPFEEEIRRKGRDTMPIEEMFLLFQEQMHNPLFKLLIVRDSARVVGYYFGMICPLPGMEGVFVYRVYAESEKVFNMLEVISHAWAKSRGATKETIVIYDNTDHFIQKHGFKQVSVNLEREI